MLISKSYKINALISILEYLINPKNQLAKSVIIDYLFKTILKKKDLHSLNIKLKTEDGFNSILEEANIYIQNDRLLQESLYEMVEQIIRLFHFNQDSHI